MRTQTCKCCGEVFESVNKRRYKPEHLPSRSERSRLVASRTAEKEIPAESFKKLLLAIKEEQGLSWSELAHKAGRSRGCMNDYMYRTDYVTKKAADDIVKRLTGVPMPPTPRQAVEYAALKQKSQLELRTDSLKAGRYIDRKAKIDNLRTKLLG
jgi:hypothetical protein